MNRFAGHTPLPNDVLLDDEDNFVASRFALQSSFIADSVEEMRMVTELRRIASDSSPDFNVTVFHKFFPFFDQFLVVPSTALKSVGLSLAAVLLVAFFALRRDISSTLVVVACVVLIQVMAVGFMVTADIRLDIISVICLIISVGFSVDFCAHVAHFYVNCDEPFEVKLRSTLATFGPPIMLSAVSTILAVVWLTETNSYILRTFAKLICAVITLGVGHGLVILPQFLFILDKIKLHRLKNTFIVNNQSVDEHQF